MEAGWISEGEKGELTRKARLTANKYEIREEPELRVLGGVHHSRGTSRLDAEELSGG